MNSFEGIKKAIKYIEEEGLPIDEKIKEIIAEIVLSINIH
jgi:hypothetical protein